MKKSKSPFRELEESWKTTKDGIELKYPIFHHSPSIPDDPMIKKTLVDVISDVDFHGWQGDSEDKIVDSTGKVFFTKYEEQEKGRFLFFFPIVWGSGLFPDKVERTMSLNEVKEIMCSGIESYKSRIDEDCEALMLKIKSCKSIEEVLNFCADYL